MFSCLQPAILTTNTCELLFFESKSSPVPFLSFFSAYRFGWPSYVGRDREPQRERNLELTPFCGACSHWYLSGYVWITAVSEALLVPVALQWCCLVAAHVQVGLHAIIDYSSFRTSPQTCWFPSNSSLLVPVAMVNYRSHCLYKFHNSDDFWGFFLYYFLGLAMCLCLQLQISFLLPSFEFSSVLAHHKFVLSVQKPGSRVFGMVQRLNALKATPRLLSLWQMSGEQEISD